MRFPYHHQELRIPDPVSGLRRVSRPIIPIRLAYQHRELPANSYYALIDSGADWCLFHDEVGHILGIPAQSKIIKHFTGVEGIRRTAYFHPLRLRIGELEVEIMAGFSEGLRFPYGILGQAGFFDRFVVTMSCAPPSAYVEITQPS